MSVSESLLGRRAGRPRLLLLLPALLLLGSTGCRMTADDLRSWVEQPDGAGKLAAIVTEAQRDPALRLVAAELLVEHGSIVELADALGRCRPDDRSRVVAALTPSLLTMLQGAGEQQVRAKEAIYYFGGYAPPQEQQQLAQGLLRWATEDLTARFKLGANHMGQVLSALGSQAAVPLLRQLRTGHSLSEATEVLVGLHSPEVDEATALLLVEQVKAALPELPLALINSLLQVNRPELTPMLADVAGNTRVDKAVRAAFLDHVLDCKGPEAAPGLARLLGEPDFRWTAAHHLLALEKLDGLRRVLASLPEDGRWPSAEGEFYQGIDFFCTDVVGSLNERKENLEPVLIEGLKDAAWPGKLAAIQCLGYFGSPAALPELTRAGEFTRRLPGWRPADSTLGQVALATAAKLQQHK